MKVSYIVALLIVVLMVGCATTTPPATPETEEPQETPPATPETPIEEIAETPTGAPIVSTAEIVVKNSGFDPAELTVNVGSIVSIKAVEGNHKLTIGGAATPTIDEGTTYDAELNKAGQVRIFDIFTKKSATVTVTE